ncbi:ribosomal protein S18-alanine N-acetyltransferase [Vagococcus acidifermentans]|uniref:Ribosomal-protein-alanine N-acetyltransferase n=1 Tax=Vagococcus acidifermentans TaxID=564710 RepID=A0A430AXR6_9ENTE|nr:ribosomal protein S18-alanine N-acetyltransferase [Vagococcus acidifermentans]RSU12857.1 ribosomal-protein-alanine N-acetyltransferase [Vagococcus acidifermentans]
MLKELNFFSVAHEYHQKTVTLDQRTLTIRRAMTQDVRGIIALLKDVYSGRSPWGTSIVWMEINRIKTSLYLVVEDEQMIVGVVGLRIGQKDAHITNIAVMRQYQGKGIGKLLMLEIGRYALQKECDTLSLEVRQSNQTAQNLYRQLGFETRGVKKRYYHDNFEDALDMVCRLKGATRRVFQ